MRALFLCSYTKEIAHYAARTVQINREYCERHGYVLECETDTDKILAGCEGRATFWYYFKMLKENFGRPDVDWFVKIDCDAVCVNHAKSLECWFGSGPDILYTSDRGGDIICAGIQLIRNSEVNRRFYQMVWDAAERVNRGGWKTGLWHEQSMLSAAYALKGDGGPEIKIVPHTCENSFGCMETESRLKDIIIFHSVDKQRISRLRWEPKTLRYVLGDPPPSSPAGMPRDTPIVVVYYAYLVNDWEPLVTEQLSRLRSCGLHAAAKEIWLITCGTKEVGDRFQKLFHDPKFRTEHSTQNRFEYSGIAKAKELADSGDWYILFFNTKGVANIWRKCGSSEVSERKLIGKRGWRNFMEFFLLDRWEECVSRLVDHDMAVAHYGAGCWPHGNFWWATSDWLKQRPPPMKGASRWDYEAWVSARKPNPRVHEWKHLLFDFHTSDWPQWIYDGSRDLSGAHIQVIRATYGALDVQIDEGRAALVEEPKSVDVTSRLKQYAAIEGGRRLSLAVNNGTMGGDPHEGSGKILKVWWTLDIPGEPTYYTAALESQSLVLELV